MRKMRNKSGRGGRAALSHRPARARRKAQKLANGYPLEPYGLLEREGYALLRALRGIQRGYVLAVQQYLSGRRHVDARDHLGESGLAAAVGTGKDYKLSVRDLYANVVEYLSVPFRGEYYVLYF